MPWVSASAVEGRVAIVIAAGNWTPGAAQRTLLESSTEDAKTDIIRILRSRGYTMTQIAKWSEQSKYQTEIGTYYYLLRTGFQKDDEQDWLDKLDLREKLEEVELFERDGTLIESGEPAEGVAQILDLEAINTALDQDP